MCETTERTEEELFAIFTKAIAQFAPPKPAEPARPAAPVEPIAPAMIKMCMHYRSSELGSAVSFLQLAAEAMNSIGNMMQPENSTADEQMNFAHRSDAAAVFRFFGAALRGPAEDAADAWDFFELKGMCPPPD